MTTRAEIRKKAAGLFAKYAKAVAAGEGFFPKSIACERSLPRSMSALFDAIRDIKSGEKSDTQAGYVIEWRTIHDKEGGFGQQDVPVRAWFRTEEDYLAAAGKARDAKRLKSDLSKIRSELPFAVEWTRSNAAKILHYDGDWNGIIDAVQAYIDNENCEGLCVREISIASDTKFIEKRKSIIRELLSLHSQAAARRFDGSLAAFIETRSFLVKGCGFGAEKGPIRLSVGDLRKAHVDVRVVFVVENKATFLSFPDAERCAVVWGEGMKVSLLKDIPWLGAARIYYWGDLDAFGFEILSCFRKSYPQAESMLMDAETFHGHYGGLSAPPARTNKDLILTKEEQSLYDEIKAANSRLEQERIPRKVVASKVAELTRQPKPEGAAKAAAGKWKRLWGWWRGD